jgi:hypothetical protein
VTSSHPLSLLSSLKCLILIFLEFIISIDFDKEQVKQHKSPRFVIISNRLLLTSS